MNSITKSHFYSARSLEALLTKFTTCLVSFIVGVSATLLFDSLVNLTLLLGLLIGFALLSIRQVIMLPLLISLIGFSWATWVFSQQFNSQLPTEYEGVSIIVTGHLQDLPKRNSHSLRFTFLISEAYSSVGESIPQLRNQSVQLSCYYCELGIQPDQSWRLSVRLKRPHGYASWGAFDYEKYLFRHQLMATGYIRSKETNDLLTDKHGWSINQWRWRLSESLDHIIPNYNIGRAIIAALMIGDKSKFNHHQQLVFQKSGLSHLMAISGLHIGLAFLVTTWLLKWGLMPIAKIYNWVPRQRLTLIPALIMAFFYAALAGFAISTQRAMIMLLIFVIARLFARELSLLKVLLITIAVILVYDPLSILDVGFWLSCLAVLVIACYVEYNKKNENLIEVDRQDALKSPKISLVRLQPLLWLGMLPVTLLFFGKISLVSPLINLVMVPLFCSALIPLTLLSLVLQIIELDFFSSHLLSILAYCYEKVFKALSWLTDFSLAQIALPPMGMLEWLIFTLVSMAYFYTWQVRHCLFILFMILLLVFNHPKELAADEFNVTLLDVGQGLAMVIQAQDYVLVYDTGPAYSSGFATADAVLIPYLQRLGIREIDLLIISHADNDHIGGLETLTSAFDIKTTLSSRTDKVPNALPCNKGQRWFVADIQFKIISPEFGTPQGSNNQSCVLMVSNTFKTLLITGDIERQVENYLLKQKAELKADIMLVPHQGSKTSSTTDFIDSVSPQMALIAAGYRNHYGHPHHDVVTRYINRDIDLFSTVESGSILLNINKNKLSVKTYRHSEKGFWNHVKKPT